MPPFSKRFSRPRRRKSIRRATSRKLLRSTIHRLTTTLRKTFSQMFGTTTADTPSVDFGDVFNSGVANGYGGGKLSFAEQGVDTLFAAGLNLLGAGREKRSVSTGESSRSQELQQQFNLSRSQRAALLSETTQHGGRNL